MNPKLCPQCGKRGMCTDTRMRVRTVYRRYTCHRDGTRWTTQEVFVARLVTEPSDDHVATQAPLAAAQNQA